MILMYKRPLILGIDAEAVRRQADLTIAQRLLQLGGNTGNMMFSEGLHAVVDNGVRSGYFLFSDAELDACDVIIIAAANWISPYSDFGDLARRLERAAKPVVICGIGVQATLAHEIPGLHKGTERLIALASDTSGAISTRGDFSAEVLNHYGFKNVISTGCPSLLLLGPGEPSLRIHARPTPEGSLIHATRHFFNRADDFQAYLYREALRQGIDILLQSELADLCVVTETPVDETDAAQTQEVLEHAYGQDIHLVGRYLRTHGKFPMALDEWVALNQTKRFCLGTRIHGTVAALVSGTPALLIAHDARTQEMAEKMSIPHVLSSDLDLQAPLDIGALYDKSSPDRFVEGYQAYRDRFLDFFRINRVPVRGPRTGQAQHDSAKPGSAQAG
jgi:polysaccharide pyruvyl transferase WcaK-like protein